jgi:effector-binding domain-containing protein
MRFGEFRRSTALTLARTLALASALGLFAMMPAQAVAQTTASPPAEEQASPATPAPAAPAEAGPGKTPETPPESDQQKAAPGVPADATAETLEVPARPVALLAGDSEWADGFKAIRTAIGKVDDAVKGAGLKQAGPPFAVFLSTDDNSFHFEAMVPIAEKPDGKSELADGVKLGESPSGKAIKFLHRGAYDDIDSTYDLITAYLDEKGLEAKNLFVEEYLTDTKESDDAGLEADIYVFLK